LHTVGIVQARTGSTRFPGKVLKPLAGRPLLSHIIERLRSAGSLDTIVIATTASSQDRPVIDLAERAGVAWYAGSEQDVLARYAEAAEMVRADLVVRVTGDCPLIDPDTVDGVVRYFRAHDFDYVGAGAADGLPRGLDTEIFTREALDRAHRLAQGTPAREHVTLYIYRHPEQFRCDRYPAPAALQRPGRRLCVDEEADYRLLAHIYDRLYRPGEIIEIRDVLALLDREPELLKINAHVRQHTV